MNRKDREITNKDEIINLLSRCDTIRLGLFNNDYPYVVPLSFGFDLCDNNLIVFFHCAKVGLKIDCIHNNQKVCVEADIFHKVEALQHGITTRYESIIGFGKIIEIFDEEKIYGLKKILNHYNYDGYNLNDCKGLQHTRVYKIILDSITGKRNLPS